MISEKESGDIFGMWATVMQGFDPRSGEMTWPKNEEIKLPVKSLSTPKIGWF
jgi:hypothetical protein